MEIPNYFTEERILNESNLDYSLRQMLIKFPERLIYSTFLFYDEYFINFNDTRVIFIKQVLKLYPAFLKTQNKKGELFLQKILKDNKKNLFFIFKKIFENIPEFLEIKNIEGQTILHLCSDLSTGIYNYVFDSVVKYKPEILSYQDIYGNTFLHYVNDTDNLEYLLKNTMFHSFETIKIKNLKGETFFDNNKFLKTIRMSLIIIDNPYVSKEKILESLK